MAQQQNLSLSLQILFHQSTSRAEKQSVLRREVDIRAVLT
jgi:hypothetical protein